ncbi:hypothetical protein Xoosp13_42 [Xanthomonas phage Xoo-sp13]|nr:hypothetical protein Xoosp13_42 [Xanthomonas phage Xoo-sp13]
MVRAVEKWVAHDGTEFHTRDEAVVYEEYILARTTLEKVLSEDGYRDGTEYVIPIHELLDHLLNNKNLRDIVTKYIAMTERKSKK